MMFRNPFTTPRADGAVDLGPGTEGLHPALVLLRDHERAARRERRARRSAWAGLCEAWSHAASPPVMVLIAYALAAGTLPGSRPWIWTGFHVAIAVAFPLSMLFMMHGRGEVDDIELTNLRQRQSPLLLTTLATGFSLFVLETAVAPALLVRLTLAYTILGLVLVFVSRRWKISVHCAGVAVAGTVIWQLHGSPLWFATGVATMAGARVALGRHTVAQTLAGSLLGSLLTLVFVF